MLKKILSNLGYALLIILLIPVIIGGVVSMFIWVGCYISLEFIFKRIRRDPIVKLKAILPDSKKEPQIITELENFFNQQTEILAEATDTRRSGVNHEYGDWETIDSERSTRNHAFECELVGRGVKAEISVEATEVKSGNKMTLECEDEDQWPSQITAKVNLTTDRISRTISVNSSVETEYFFTQIMKMNYRINRKIKPSQLWVPIAEKNLWLVEYDVDSTPYIGYRRGYSDKRARKLWIDTVK